MAKIIPFRIKTISVKRLFLVLIILLSTIFFISNENGLASQVQSNRGKNKAIEIAKADVSKIYRNLEMYKIEVREKNRKWCIDFVLRDTGLNGGGPHYIISKKTGKILKKIYHQ